MVHVLHGSEVAQTTRPETRAAYGIRVEVDRAMKGHLDRDGVSVGSVDLRSLSLRGSVKREAASNGAWRTALFDLFHAETNPVLGNHDALLTVCGLRGWPFSARRPGAGAVPGRSGACLAVRTQPAAFVTLRSPRPKR